MAGITLFAATLVGGSGYVIRELHRQLGAATPLTLLAAPTPEMSPVIAVTTDMLQVSAILLGRVRLAIVNHTPLTEGQSLEVRTSDGTATLRVTSIADGVVQFKYGGTTISARLAPPLPLGKSR